MLSIIVLERKLESAKIGIGRSHFQKNRKSGLAKKIAIGASLNKTLKENRKTLAVKSIESIGSIHGLKFSCTVPDLWHVAFAWKKERSFKKNKKRSSS